MGTEPIEVLALIEAHDHGNGIDRDRPSASLQNLLMQINNSPGEVQFAVEFACFGEYWRNSSQNGKRVNFFPHLYTYKFAIIIVDFSQQLFVDLDLIGQIKLLVFDIPIVVVGCSENEATYLKCIRYGAQDYLILSQLNISTLRYHLISTYERSRWQQSIPATGKPESHFRTIFERSSVGIALIDMTGHLVDVNPALCKLLNYERNHLFGKRFTDLVDRAPGDLEVYQQLVSYPLERLEMERQFLCRDGSLLWTNLNLSLIPNVDGEPAYYLAMIEDISDRKKSELKLRETKEAAEAGNKAKSEFLATMSHELRTPLHAIMGLSQLLAQQLVGELNDKQLEYLNCIYSSGEHLLALINDILDLSKVEAGKEELVLLQIPIHDICNYVISTVSDRAISKGLELTLQINTDEDSCIADERRLKQMLLNLLTNAIKFTSSGEVKLVVETVGPYFNFHVIDTGIGIDSNSFEVLFEPFTQVDSSLNRQYEGTGLGLALTRKIARLHGGDVIVESVPHQGSKFTLVLPSRQNLHDNSIVDSGAISSGVQDNQSVEIGAIDEKTVNLPVESKRIFLVEDEQNTAMLLQDYLQTIGYQVEISADGDRFIERVRQFDADLILLDIHLAGSLTGMDLLEELRQQPDFDYLPVIVVTPTAISDRQKFLYAGANDVLSKPIGIVQLESILMRYIN